MKNLYKNLKEGVVKGGAWKFGNFPKKGVVKNLANFQKKGGV
jgi:hypothetical protein